MGRTSEKASGSRKAEPRAVAAQRVWRALEEAAVERLAVAGWDALSARGLSAAAGTTSGAIYSRFEHLGELVSQVWAERLWPAVGGRLEVALSSLEGDGGEEDFVATMLELATPSLDHRAAAELLQAALVDEVVSNFVLRDVADLLERWAAVSPERGEVDATVGAACCYLGVGLLLLATRPWAAGIDLGPELRRYYRALRAPGTPVATPRDRIAEYLYAYRFDVDDERLERVLLATAVSVGEVGYQATTISRICRAAGVSSGFVMGRFPSKLALFQRVTDEMWGRGLSLITDFISEQAEEIGPVMAEALAWREMQNPALRKVAVLSIEQARLAGFEPAIAAVLGAREEEFMARYTASLPAAFFFSEFAIGNGMIALACVRPELRDLPFACVTEPLLASAPH